MKCKIVFRNELVPAFVQLLSDTEAEVRVASAKKVSPFCQFVEVDKIVESILPHVKELSTDSSQYVRISLASVAMQLAPLLGKNETINHLIPVLLSLLKDTCPDVRLNVISNLDKVNQVTS